MMGCGLPKPRELLVVVVARGARALTSKRGSNTTFTSILALYPPANRTIWIQRLAQTPVLYFCLWESGIAVHGAVCSMNGTRLHFSLSAIPRKMVNKLLSSSCCYLTISPVRLYRQLSCEVRSMHLDHNRHPRRASCSPHPAL